MTAESLYEQVLGQCGGEAPAPRPCRPSAAVVPWRRTRRGRVEVFWVRRSPELAFMGGWHAFPGGGLSRRDADLPVSGTPRGLEDPEATSDQPAMLAGDTAGEPDLVPGLAACALRELFEETGILLVGGPAPEAGNLERARRSLLAKEVRFAEVVGQLGVELDATPLVFAGRWRTPPFAPLRFDNRFFLLEWPEAAAPQPTIIPGELVEGAWIEAGEAHTAWLRGEVMAAPPILHLLRVLAEAGPEAGLPRLRRPVEADLGPFRKIEMRPGVVMLPLATATLPPATHTNAYLLGHGEAVLVDPGSADPGELDALAAAVDDFHRRGGRVTAIWLTHHHPDHVGGVEHLRRHLGVPVLAHALTGERLAGRGIRLDGQLVDGERITLAGDPPMTVRAVHTPGHARGHLAFLDETGGSALAGDLVAGVGTIVVDPPEGDMDDYLASLDKLAALAPRILFPAHGPALLDAVGKLRGYVAHRLWREERILAAWQDGVRDPDELLPRVYDDAPQQAWPLARRQLEAHLLRLERAGRIDR